MPDKMIHRIIREPILQTETYFYVCADVNKVINHLSGKYLISIKKEEFENANGICIKIHNKISANTMKRHCWVVWMEYGPDLRLTVHEAGHLVFCMLDEHGICVDVDNQETFCYFLDFFTQEFWKVMEETLTTNKKKR